MALKGMKCYFIMVATAMLQLSFVLVTEIFGINDNGLLFGPIFETVIGIGYIASILFAVNEDMRFGGLKRITLIMIIGLILRVLIMPLARMGIALIGACTLLAFAGIAVGPTLCTLYIKIIDFWGLGKLIGAVAITLILAVAVTGFLG